MINLIIWTLNNINDNCEGPKCLKINILKLNIMLMICFFNFSQIFYKILQIK